jgi:hypothetical protein
MSFSSDRAIAALADRFIRRTLPKADWTHAAHFAVALYLLSTRGGATYAEMPPLIRAYNDATGVANTDTDGYHETITLASIRAADARLASAPPDRALHVVLSDLMASAFGRSDWLLRHWSKARLFSPEARKHWCEPDLAPLRF